MKKLSDRRDERSHRSRLASVPKELRSLLVLSPDGVDAQGVELELVLKSGQSQAQDQQKPLQVADPHEKSHCSEQLSLASDQKLVERAPMEKISSVAYSHGRLFKRLSKAVIVVLTLYLCFFGQPMKLIEGVVQVVWCGPTSEVSNVWTCE